MKYIHIYIYIIYNIFLHIYNKYYIYIYILIYYRKYIYLKKIERKKSYHWRYIQFSFFRSFRIGRLLRGLNDALKLCDIQQMEICICENNMLLSARFIIRASRSLMFVIPQLFYITEMKSELSQIELSSLDKVLLSKNWNNWSRAMKLYILQNYKIISENNVPWTKMLFFSKGINISLIYQI